MRRDSSFRFIDRLFGALPVGFLNIGDQKAGSALIEATQSRDPAALRQKKPRQSPNKR